MLFSLHWIWIVCDSINVHSCGSECHDQNEIRFKAGKSVLSWTTTSFLIYVCDAVCRCINWLGDKKKRCLSNCCRKIGIFSHQLRGPMGLVKNGHETEKEKHIREYSAQKMSHFKFTTALTLQIIGFTSPLDLIWLKLIKFFHKMHLASPQPITMRTKSGNFTPIQDTAKEEVFKIKFKMQMWWVNWERVKKRIKIDTDQNALWGWKIFVLTNIIKLKARSLFVEYFIQNPPHAFN